MEKKAELLALFWAGLSNKKKNTTRRRLNKRMRTQRTSIRVKNSARKMMQGATHSHQGV